jgi:hypothetical protein
MNWISGLNWFRGRQCTASNSGRETPGYVSGARAIPNGFGSQASVAANRNAVRLGGSHVALSAAVARPFPARVGAQADGGSESLARFVEELKPILIVQGHEHRWAGLSGRTASALVINPSRAGMVVVVDTDANHVAIDG